MNDGTDPIHHVREELHEVCDRVGVGLQLDILEEPIQRCLPIEFREGDGWFGRALVLLGGGVASIGGGVMFCGGAGRN